MQLYLNHVLTQASLNKLNAETKFSFSQLALTLAQEQDLSLPGQLIFLLDSGFCRQKLYASQTLKEEVARLLHAAPNATSMAIFLNAIHQKLIVPTTLTLPTQPEDDPSFQYCFKLATIVKYWLVTRSRHGPALALSHLAKRTIHTPPPTNSADQIIIPQEETSNLVVTIPVSVYNYFVSLSKSYNIQSSRARNDTGQAAAAIEALVRELI